MATNIRNSETFWRNMRWLYNGGGFLIAGVFAFYFIPNLILFGKWTWLSPADYATVTQQRLVPVVRAIKEYKRDRGKCPTRVDDLVPAYLPEKPRNSAWQIEIQTDQVNFYSVLRGREMVFYFFSPPPNGLWTVRVGFHAPFQIPAPTEGWYLESGYVSGQIPLPPVAIDASTKPASVHNP
jgi:hypothetical protein